MAPPELAARIFELPAEAPECVLLVAPPGDEAGRAVADLVRAGRLLVRSAGSAQEALRLLLREDPTVIVCALQLPDMQGWELARLVRQRERAREIPILFFAANATEGEIARAYASGGADLLVPPFVAEAVRSRLAVLFELRRERSELRRQRALIEEARRLEEELALTGLRLGAERRFRSLAELMPQIVWTASSGGHVDWLNRRWFEFSGRPADRSGEGWLAHVHPDDAAGVRTAWSQAVKTGEDFRAECRLRRGDGAHTWHLCRAVPERGDDDAIASWLGTCTDIDEQRRAADSLARMSEGLERAVHLRDEFLSIASHELRTPLTSLRVQLDLLLRKHREDAGDLPTRLHVIDRQVRRLNRLIDQLLDVTRIERGTLALECETFDLAELVAEVAASFSGEAERAGSAIRLALAPAVGSWDRGRIEQVVTNLLGNAIKFGKGRPIDLRLRQRGGRVRLAVCDRGIGFAPEDGERIFERFVRGVSASSFGGLGLGLYITRQLVHAHGGSIRVRSAPGRGAIFVVDLPCARSLGTRGGGPIPG